MEARSGAVLNWQSPVAAGSAASPTERKPEREEPEIGSAYRAGVGGSEFTPDSDSFVDRGGPLTQRQPRWQLPP